MLIIGNRVSNSGTPTLYVWIIVDLAPIKLVYCSLSPTGLTDESTKVMQTGILPPCLGIRKIRHVYSPTALIAGNGGTGLSVSFGSAPSHIQSAKIWDIGFVAGDTEFSPEASLILNSKNPPSGGRRRGIVGPSVNSITASHSIKTPRWGDVTICSHYSPSPSRAGNAGSWCSRIPNSTGSVE